MKKSKIWNLTSIIVCGMMIGAVSSASERVYKTSQGVIQLSSLESALSVKLKADVSDAQLRLTMDPFELWSNVRDTAIYKSYHLKFKINETQNKTHDVSCDFTMISNKGRIMIPNCSSKTAVVDVVGFLAYSDVGIHKWTPPPTKVIFR